MMKTENFNRNDVELKSVTTVAKSYYHIDKYVFRHRLFAGGWGAELSRDVFERGAAIVCLPYDPVKDEVVLIEQFRIGSYAAGAEDCWLLEAVAGIIEEDEEIEEVVHRESLEEADCILSNLELIGEYYATPGACSEKFFVYIGKTDSSEIGGIHGLDEEGEDIRVSSYPFDEAVMLLKKGKITNISLVVALQWLMLNKQDLRNTWLNTK